MFLSVFWCASCRRLYAFQPSTLPAEGLPRCEMCTGGVNASLLAWLALLPGSELPGPELAPVTFNAYQGGLVAPQVDEDAAPLAGLGLGAGATSRAQLEAPAAFPVADPLPRNDLAPGEIVVWIRGRHPSTDYQEARYCSMYARWPDVLQVPSPGRS